MQAYSVQCPTCLKKRDVSHTQHWRITSPKGRSSGNCKSCAETGSHKNLGQKRPNNATEGQKRAMRGNQFARGFHDYTPEERQRRREVMLGNKFNPGKRGADHHSWKGGKGTERHIAQGRLEYKQWRSAIFQRDNYTCQICDQYRGYLHADHIKSWAEYPGLRYDVGNGRTLCRACHYYVTFKRKMEATSRWGLTKQEK